MNLPSNIYSLLIGALFVFSSSAQDQKEQPSGLILRATPEVRADLQPTKNGPIAPNNVIDQAGLQLGASLIELPNDITPKQILDPKLQSQRNSLKGVYCSCESAQPSALWNLYLEAKKKGQKTPVLDFSYVGYKRGEMGIPDVRTKKFSVVEFGAVPNDGKSDKEAIQKTIDAASEAGGGVVTFPAGRFLINEACDDQKSLLLIKASGVVLRGAGSGAHGTELFMAQSLEAKDATKMWTTPYLVQVSAPYNRVKKLASITQSSLTDKMTVYVDSSEAIQVSDWVSMRRRDQSEQAIKEALAPYSPDPEWTNITEGGVNILEYHQVKSLTHNSLTFHEPVHYDVEPNAGWTVESYHPIEQVGIEDLAFVGNWHEEFVHHKSALHDGGWSMLSLSHVVNGWVKRCRFTDLNNALSLNYCSNMTAIELILDGNKGHAAVAFRNSSHCLGALIDDTAGQHHASGVGGMSSGNVFWRINYRSDTSFEAHASQPRHTLFDQLHGGFIDGRWGGAARNQPNHLEGLVLWNYHNTSKDNPKPYEFVKTKAKYGKIIMPQVIGFHGGHVNFVQKQTKTLESQGAPVSPASLYEAQLKHRFGKLPHWLVELKN